MENNPNAIQCIMENLKKTQLEDQAEVIREDVFSALRRLDGREKFDYVFMDPPYKWYSSGFPCYDSHLIVLLIYDVRNYSIIPKHRVFCLLTLTTYYTFL